MMIWPTLICPRFAEVQGKVQFLGGKFRSENLCVQHSVLRVISCSIYSATTHNSDVRRSSS